MKTTKKFKPKYSEEILEIVARFDSLPDSAHIPPLAVCAWKSISSPSLYRKIKQKLLPEPEKFGDRMSRFNVGKLRRCPLNGGSDAVA